jgi:hypothetical protein
MDGTITWPIAAVLATALITILKYLKDTKRKPYREDDLNTINKKLDTQGEKVVEHDKDIALIKQDVCTIKGNQKEMKQLQKEHTGQILALTGNVKNGFEKLEKWLDGKNKED